jgi:hypothetical protein
MKFILPVFLTCLYSFSYSQMVQTSINDETKRQFIFFEIGKTGVIYNLGYDHQLAGMKTGFRVVAGSNLGRYQKLTAFGGGVYQLFGRIKNYFEAGADFYYLNVSIISDDQRGVNFIYPDYSTKTFYAGANIGYRHSSNKKLFRIGISPGVTKTEFIPGGYISFGLAL